MFDRSDQPTLSVRGLEVAYRVRGREHTVLRELSFEIGHGESFGLVGESGCGKSTAAITIARHLASNARVRKGEVLLGGENILKMSKTRLREVRAKDISMVYQEPGRSLNPSMRIERQITEVYRLTGLSPKAARDAAAEMLRKVQISTPDRIFAAYPHELSGGMQQRVVIAMALATNPSLLILDEPTTALDATVGAEVLDIVEGLRREMGTSVLLISHNLALVSQICDRVGVLYAGLLVDQGPSDHVFVNANHPYTAALLDCIPDTTTVKDGKPLVSIPGALPKAGDRLVGCPYSDRCPLADDRCRIEEPPAETVGDRTFRCFHHDIAQSAVGADEEGAASQRLRDIDYAAPPLLRVLNASKTFVSRTGKFKALEDISLDIWPGETLGIVGESGSGKSTLGRIIMGLVEPDPGCAIEHRSAGKTQDTVHSAPQMVFQNPDASLNRSHRVSYILGRSIKKLRSISVPNLAGAVAKLAADFKIAPEQLEKRPLRLSGGQKQRVAIARSFAGDPALVVCDEPTSALDVSVQASVLNLLMKLQAKNDVAFMFITHDLGVVRYVSDRIAVMYLGQIVEIGPAAAVFSGPHHPYTEILLSAVPTLSGPQRERIRMAEMPHAALRSKTGCPFQDRCPRKIGPVCESDAPPFKNVGADHRVRCHHQPLNLPTAAGQPIPPDTFAHLKGEYRATPLPGNT